MELISPEYVKYIYEVNRLRIKAAESITYRDALQYHICKNLTVDYMLKIGSLEYKVMEIKNKVKKARKILELCQTTDIPYEEIDIAVEKQFLEQDYKIVLMSEAVENAVKKSHEHLLSEEEIIDLNSYYLVLVKDFSPEVNKSLTEEERLLFSSIVQKYISGNLKEIKKYQRFEKQELYFDELDTYKSEKDRLEKLINRVDEEIVSMKNSFPYTEKLELEDENLFRRKKDTINKDFLDLQDLLENLEKEIKKYRK